MAQFEVRCLQCDVSFPVGTKRCMHCGNKIGRTPRSSPELAEMPFPVAEVEPTAHGATADDRLLGLPGFGGAAEDAGEEGESVPRSVARVGMTLVWVLILVVGLLTRLCESQ